GLLEGQMFWHRDERFGADGLVLGQPSVVIDNPLLGHRIERSAEEVREEGVDDQVAGFAARYARADRDHFASAIRERHTAGRDRHRILAIENHHVTEVERTRPYSDEHLANARRWNVSLGEDEAVQTSDPIKLVR